VRADRLLFTTDRKRRQAVRKALILALVLTIPPLGACASYGDDRYGYDRPGDRSGYQDRDRRGYENRDRDRRDRRQAQYLRDNDQIYRDRDGRYYCKRSDGTTGAIVGALAGGVLGNIIAPGGSKTLGTILGAGGGALAGNAIDKNDVRCE
jgi:hypothetical protein